MRGLVLLVAVGTLSAPVAAWAQSPAAPGAAIDIRRYYPAEAARLEIEGAVELLCRVQASGLMDGCEVVSETPPGHGFGEAALKMSGLFKMRPMTRDGQPVAGGTVRIPLKFKLP